MTTNDYFTVPDNARLLRRSLDALAPDLLKLNLIDAKDFAEAQALFDRADVAQGTATAHKGHIIDRTREIGAELAHVDIDADAIHAEAAKLADLTHVLRISEAIWTVAVREATRLVYSKADQYADALNAELDALAEKAAEVAAKLTGITSADAALLAGKGDDWIEAGELAATYQWLRGVIGRLREADKLPKPRNGEGGAFWNFRTPPELIRGGFKVATADTDGGRAKFFREMAAGPWVPTREEALAAVEVHDSAQIAFQTGGRV